MRKEKNGLWPMLVSAAACCTMAALALGLPAAAARWQDARLLSRPAERPVVAGALSEQARGIPVLYALHKERYLAGSSPWAADTSGQAVEQIAQRAEELRAAAVLDDETMAALAALLAQGGEKAEPGAAAQPQEQREFYRACTPMSAQGDRADLTWHAGSGLVTELSLVLPCCPQDGQAVVEAYRTYLGLDLLEDWQPAALESGGAACWSPTGQAYLYCSSRECGGLWYFTLGVSALTAQEVAAVQ